MPKKEYRGNYTSKKTKRELAKALVKSLPHNKELTIFCVGTDRSTGDALGPLVGSFLLKHKKKLNELNIKVYGHIDEPIHACNLEKNYKNLNKDCFILAIDACLGKESSFGDIILENNPLKPGAGLNKQLLEVGDKHIKMVVGINGPNNKNNLHFTRLSIVMNGAKIIADSILLAKKEIQKNQKNLLKHVKKTS